MMQMEKGKKGRINKFEEYCKFRNIHMHHDYIYSGDFVREFLKNSYFYIIHQQYCNYDNELIFLRHDM